MPQKFKTDDWVKVTALNKRVQVIDYVRNIATGIAAAMGEPIINRDQFFTNKIRCRVYGETSGIKIYTEDELEPFVAAEKIL